MSLLSTISWDSVDLSLKKFVKLFGGKLPALIKLTDGFEGADESLAYSCNDVYWVVAIETQRLVLLGDSKGRYLSVPTDAQVFFSIIGAGCSRLSASDLIKVQLGTKVQLLPSSNLENFQMNDKNTKSVLSIIKHGSLELLDIYENRLILCHSIINSKLNPLVHRMPVYVPVNLVTASGVKPASQKNFANLIEEFRQNEKLLTKKYEPFNKIHIYDKLPGDKNDYEFLSPDIVCYINSVTAKMQSAVATCDDDDPDYDTIDINAVLRKTSLQKSPAPPPARNMATCSYKKAPALPPIDCKIENKDARTKQEFINDACKVKTPVEKEGTISFKTEAIKPASKTTTTPPPPIKSFKAPATLPSSGIYQTNNNRVISDLKKTLNSKIDEPTSSDPVKKPTAVALRVTSVVSDKSEGNTKLISPVQNIVKKSDNPDNKVKPETGILNSLDIDGDYDYNDVGPFSSNKNKRQSLFDFSTISKTNDTKSTKIKLPYKQEMIYKSLNEVPVDISNLTRTQISDIMRLMKISEEKVQLLNENLVDGQLLLGLDRDILVNEFKFNQFEAQKIVKFSKEQWRPS